MHLWQFQHLMVKVYQDSTSPEIAIANLVKYDNSNKTLTCNLTASDNETCIQYYAYSFDNGLSWSILCPWNGMNNNHMTVAVNNVPASSGTVMFKVWNQYDQSTDTSDYLLGRDDKAIMYNKK